MVKKEGVGSFSLGMSAGVSLVLVRVRVRVLALALVLVLVVVLAPVLVLVCDGCFAQTNQPRKTQQIPRVMCGSIAQLTTYEAIKRALGGGDDDYAIQTVASVISSAVSTTCFCPFDVCTCIMHTPCMCGCVLDGTRVLQACPVEWFPFPCSPVLLFCFSREGYLEQADGR